MSALPATLPPTLAQRLAGCLADRGGTARARDLVERLRDHAVPIDTLPAGGAIVTLRDGSLLWSGETGYDAVYPIGDSAWRSEGDYTVVYVRDPLTGRALEALDAYGDDPTEDEVRRAYRDVYRVYPDPDEAPQTLWAHVVAAAGGAR